MPTPMVYPLGTVQYLAVGGIEERYGGGVYVYGGTGRVTYKQSYSLCMIFYGARRGQKGGTVDDVKCSNAFLRAVPAFEYDTCSMITDCDTIKNDLCVNQVNVINQFIQQATHSRLCSRKVTRRIRDREPSRISLRKFIIIN